jgi:hypothetical protein
MQFVKPTPDYEVFCQDVAKAAALIEVPCNMEMVRSIFATYWEYCHSGWLSFRTTTKPNRELSVRYIDVNIPHDPYAIAVEHGYLMPQGHPVEQLIYDLRDNFPTLGYGVDLSASYGMEKIWPLVQTAVRVEDLYDLPSMPRSLQATDAYFKKYDLKWTSLYAIDYRHKSMNIYFMFPERGHFSPATTGEMIRDLGFEVPDQAELEVNSQVGALYYTFTWDSPVCTRISYAVPHQPASGFPMEWDEKFARLMQQCPTMLHEIRGSAQTAYSAKGNYRKIEVDYTGMEYSMVAGIEALLKVLAA